MPIEMTLICDICGASDNVQDVSGYVGIKHMRFDEEKKPLAISFSEYLAGVGYVEAEFKPYTHIYLCPDHFQAYKNKVEEWLIEDNVKEGRIYQ